MENFSVNYLAGKANDVTMLSICFWVSLLFQRQPEVNEIFILRIWILICGEKQIFIWFVFSGG